LDNPLPYQYKTPPYFREVSQKSGLTKAQLHTESVPGISREGRERRCDAVAAKFKADVDRVNIPSLVLNTDTPCGADRATGGAAAVDVVGSPLPDLILTRLGAHPLLYENMGNFSFVDVSQAAGFSKIGVDTNGVAVGDVDNDGDVDIFFSVMYARSAILLINQGDGTFKDETNLRNATLGDGHIQLGTGATFYDYDEDGWLDLHTNEWYPPNFIPTLGPSHARLLRNLGASGLPGHFEDVTVKSGVSLERPNFPITSYASVFHDLDEDGDADLVVVSDFGLTEYFWANSDGTFTRDSVHPRFEDSNGMGVALGDTDGDGSAELYITAIYTDPNCHPLDEFIIETRQKSEITIVFGWTGSRLFKYVKDHGLVDISSRAGVRNILWGWGASFGDFRNTGHLDLIAVGGQYGVDLRPKNKVSPDACYLREPPKFWINDGFGNFMDVAAQAGLGLPLTAKGVVVFDADGDGREDILVTRDYDTPLLFKNETKTSNNFIKIKVLNEHGAPTPGVKVEIILEGVNRTITRWSGPLGSFLTASEPVLHVGIGPATVAKVLVHYRDGVRVVENLKAGGIYEVRP
jgi:hypothetical protein